MIKKIYHGSEHRIEKPIHGFGKKYNDYGIGFYCTENIDMAKEWSVSATRDGFTNEYEIELDGLSILNLNGPEFCILHRLAVLLENRTFDALSPLAQEAKDYITNRFSLNYEQGQKNINNAKAEYVLSLARVLSCRPEELLEH